MPPLLEWVVTAACWVAAKQVTALMMVTAHDALVLSKNTADKAKQGAQATLAGCIICCILNFSLVRRRLGEGERKNALGFFWGGKRARHVRCQRGP
jgi:hypothetical protein